ncbi:Usually multiple acids move in and out Transporters 24 [Hibiscus trionum]|uniref:WAT1-related protein n=1 Tax=Hibiscus trionum TaxID=183268 RepID=A0A9W7LJK4_HIBTR|nr:Usually multiple acids move in and out Transporters 24 [Hibiscus trionum]
MENKLCEILERGKVVIVLLVVQAALAGVIVFYKLAVVEGMSMRVLIAYRFIFATACVTPLAFVFERESKASLTWKVLFLGVLSGLFGGALGPNLFIASLSLTSSTYATAMSNLVPIATFIFAVVLRMERVGMKTLGGQGKLVGTLLSIGGAMILTFYKGKEIVVWSTNINLIKRHGSTKHAAAADQVLGSLLALGSCVAFAIWYIIQAKMSEVYPFTYSASALFCITASLQATLYTIITERNWSAWKLGWNLRLLSAVFTGVIGTGLTVVLMSWCLRLRGPLFVSIFNPLTLVYVAIVGSLIFNEKLSIGSILGSVIIVVGVYVVLWGKAKEKKTPTQLAAPAERPAEPETLNVVIQDTDQNCDPRKAILS